MQWQSVFNSFNCMDIHLWKKKVHLPPLFPISNRKYIFNQVFGQTESKVGNAEHAEKCSSWELTLNCPEPPEHHPNIQRISVGLP